MKPEDIARAIVSIRGKTSRVAMHKIAFLTDYEFYLRRLLSSIALSKFGYKVRPKTESGLNYYNAKLGPFSTRLQNAIERLIESGELEEVFEDGRFLYAPGELKEHRLKGYFLEVMKKYIGLSDKRLVSLALKRSRYFFHEPKR